MRKTTKKRTGAAKKNMPAKKRAAIKPPRIRAKRAGAAAKKASRPAPQKAAATRETGDKLSFNHAMIYLKDVQRGMEFYRDWLGFKLIEDFRHEGRPVYARLRAPGGDGTLALHQAGPGASVASDGVRLYFEVRELDEFCQRLRKRGFYFMQLPQMMPWGWRHAYLNDPEGHEISLYWAGEQRMNKSVMKVATQAGVR